MFSRQFDGSYDTEPVQSISWELPSKDRSSHEMPRVKGVSQCKLVCNTVITSSNLVRASYKHTAQNGETCSAHLFLSARKLHTVANSAHMCYTESVQPPPLRYP